MKESPITGVTYYVSHPDDSYSVADPQPQLISSPQQAASPDSVVVPREPTEGWLLYTSGDGNFSCFCATQEDVRRFIAIAIFGSLEDADREQVDSFVADFNSPDQWAGLTWDLSFEDGGIHAVKLEPLLAAAPKGDKHEV